MNLPNSVIMQGKQAIQSLWGDSVTVSRSDTSHRSPIDVVVYSDVKCHLSQGSQVALDQTTTAATTSGTFALYVDTVVNIKEGDNLIIAHKGQLFKAVAGQPFNRNFSNVVKVEVEKTS